MSGRSIPEFSLKDTDGRLHGNRSLADKVLVLYFQMPTFGWRGDDTSGLDKLEELRAEFESRGVTVLCVHSGDRPEALAEKIRARGHRLTVLHDDGGMLRREFFERQWDGGIVLVGRDGVVQGRYAAFISDTQLKSLRSDVEKLLAGEALPGGRALTEEEIEEMTDQQSAMFLPNAADPLHEDYIKERWSVRAQDSGSNWGMGTGQSTGPGEGMWVRDKDTLMQIDADGRVVREMPLAEPSREQMAQEQYVIGRVGSRMGVVYMSTVPGESQNQWGFKPPKAARFVASDESGRKLWELEVDAEMASVPAHLALADLDGRPGDELVFYHRGVVWVVDSKGEVLVRRSIPTGWVLWMRVQDADRDGKAEIYVRTQSRLHRYDYAR